ncbi:anti-sigma-F factor Fin [Bacillus horti]|uniref:Anti-sigma-F factor Fin family protein n=1 Tax=Caldalkalibacillus horti TaxID=77523 RepID=A0ABT9W3D3_9BACI|nr:anti-sigma-F factor Fin [Bacillus horti]MDQ0167582.1 hypothetical protein [Bacillus horti]
MSYRYVCRYCNQQLGLLTNNQLNEQELGFHTLSPEEKENILKKQENGDTHVHIVCEHCQDTIQRHPELLLHPNILQ